LNIVPVNLPIPAHFQRGLICTVHPRILAPLVPGEEYRAAAPPPGKEEPPADIADRSLGEARANELFNALTARALHRARSYFDLTEPGVDMTIVRREWACLQTGKTARPLLAHVTLNFDPPFDA
jgi:hypothetical protein